MAAEKFRVTQRVMEKSMMGLKNRDSVRYSTLRRESGVKDLEEAAASLEWVKHVARLDRTR